MGSSDRKLTRKGSVAKKKQLLLKTGMTKEGSLKQSRKVRNKTGTPEFLGSKSWTGMAKKRPLPEWKLV